MGWLCQQRGVALVSALLAVALLMLVVVEFTYSSQIDTSQAKNALRVVQASCLAQSGVNLAKLALERDAKVGGVDSLGDEWAEALPPLPAGQGLISVRISDEQGKLNLNALRHANGTILGPWREVAERLFEIRGVDVGLLDPLLDWLDSDHFPEPRGAERDHYANRTPPIVPRNGPLLTLGELGWIDGLQPSVLNRLRDVVTVLPSNRTQVNVNTAPADVLLALFPELAPDPLETFLNSRTREPVRGTGELIERLDFSPQAPPLTLRLTTVRTNFFAIVAQARVEPVQHGVQVVVHRRQTKVTPLLWQPVSSVGPIPASRSEGRS